MERERGRDLLEHAERIREDYTDLVDKAPTEDKIEIDAVYEQGSFGLEPWEIAEITQRVIDKLPPPIQAGDTDELFDSIYEAINEAFDRARR